MKTIPTLALLSLFALPALHAQSAEGFDTPNTAPSAATADLKPAPAAAAPAAAPAKAAPAAPAAAPAAAVKKVPSRYAGSGPELDAYIASHAARFAILKKGNQATDVFGRYQDPNYVSAQPQQIVKSGPRPTIAKVPQTPFPEVVNAIEVNTLIPAKKQFLVGSRKFAVKDVLPIRLPTGKTVKAQVMDVSAKEITFRNADTGETAIRKMAALPEGMVRGNGGITAPGMQSTSPNAPIEIQISPPAPPMSSTDR